MTAGLAIHVEQTDALVIAQGMGGHASLLGNLGDGVGGSSTAMALMTTHHKTSSAPEVKGTRQRARSPPPPPLLRASDPHRVALRLMW
jgi:hypothetical protein